MDGNGAAVSDKLAWSCWLSLSWKPRHCKTALLFGCSLYHNHCIPRPLQQDIRGIEALLRIWKPKRWYQHIAWPDNTLCFGSSQNPVDTPDACYCPATHQERVLPRGQSSTQHFDCAWCRQTPLGRWNGIATKLWTNPVWVRNTSNIQEQHGTTT